jgi:hypothetical protein
MEENSRKSLRITMRKNTAYQKLPTLGKTNITNISACLKGKELLPLVINTNIMKLQNLKIF